MDLMTRKAIIKIASDEIIKPIVLNIREKLAQNFDITSGENEDFSGLCDLAVEMFIEEIKEYSKKHHDYKMKEDPDFETFFKSNFKDIRSIMEEDGGFSIKAYAVHGEQKHTPRLKSGNWVYQHTWACVELFGIKIYVDPTCQQFRWLYDYIPDYYISTKKPEWFYLDTNNPMYSGILGKLDKKVKFHITTGIHKRKIKVGIIEFIQYEVWGRISDFIRDRLPE